MIYIINPRCACAGGLHGTCLVCLSVCLCVCLYVFVSVTTLAGEVNIVRFYIPSKVRMTFF